MAESVFGNPVFNIAEVAEQLRCSESMVFKLARQSKLELVKLGSRSVVTASELQRFVNSLTPRAAKTERKSGRKPRRVA